MEIKIEQAPIKVTAKTNSHAKNMADAMKSMKIGEGFAIICTRQHANAACMWGSAFVGAHFSVQEADDKRTWIVRKA